MNIQTMRRWMGTALMTGALLLAPPFFVNGSGGSPGGHAMAMAMAMAAEGAPNACGCYQDTSGSCLCGKKSRCGCPGECEPKGCEEKREKEMRKEIEAETKKAQQASRQSTPTNTSSARVRPAAEPSAPAQSAERERPAKVKHMSAAQKRELLRLLDLYAGEHADHTSRSIDEVRGELTNAQ